MKGRLMGRGLDSRPRYSKKQEGNEKIFGTPHPTALAFKPPDGGIFVASDSCFATKLKSYIPAKKPLLTSKHWRPSS